MIEIMVVVGVVFVVLTLALPNMLRSRMNSNELAGLANCKIIFNACQSYFANTAPSSYPSGLEDLVPPVSVPPYIDSVLASGVKQGYRFIYERRDVYSFILRANPVSLGAAKKHYYVDETGTFRVSTTGPAGPSDIGVSG